MKTLKKLFFASLLLSALLFVSNSAFAFSCKTVQGPGSPDECWTEVTISSVETNLISAGTLLVYDSDGGTPAQGGYQARIARASSDNNIVAGFAQKVMVTGETGKVQVRGWGLVRTTGGVSTGDNLFAAASGNVAAFTGPNTSTYSSVDPIAVDLQASTTNGSAARFAYIRI